MRKIKSDFKRTKEKENEWLNHLKNFLKEDEEIIELQCWEYKNKINITYDVVFMGNKVQKHMSISYKKDLTEIEEKEIIKKFFNEGKKVEKTRTTHIKGINIINYWQELKGD